MNLAGSNPTFSLCADQANPALHVDDTNNAVDSSTLIREASDRLAARGRTVADTALTEAYRLRYLNALGALADTAQPDNAQPHDGQTSESDHESPKM